MLEALGQAALRSLLLAGVVQLTLWLFRIRHAQLRLTVWTVVLVASLAMPALQQVRELQTTVTLDFPVPAFMERGNPQIAASDQQAVIAVLPSDAAPSRGTWPWLQTAYLLVGGTLLLRATIGVALSIRLLRRASPVEGDWAAGTRIRVSPDVTAPVTVFNVILLPSDIADWPMAMRLAVLSHERAHVARLDYVMLLVSQLNRAIFWFSPLSWWLHCRLTTLAELVSDDQALQATGNRSGYAEVLLEMGRRSGPLLRELAMARPAMLVYRIERVLRGSEAPRPVGWLSRLTALIGAAVLAFVVASPEPRSGSAANLDEGAQDRRALAMADVDKPPAAAAIDDGLDMAATSVNKPGDVLQGGSGSTSRPLVPPMPRVRPTQRVAARIAASSLKHHVMREVTAGPPLRQATRIAKETRAMEEPYVASGKPDADHDGLPPPLHPGGVRSIEPRLFKLIDQQTCSGAYLPGPAGLYRGDWLNMISAKFFRSSDGTPWLTFHVGGRTPVNLPVKVTGGGMEFVGMQATTFKVVPKGANHLTGTTQQPYGTIDLACGGANSHLFDVME